MPTKPALSCAQDKHKHTTHLFSSRWQKKKRKKKRSFMYRQLLLVLLPNIRRAKQNGKQHHTPIPTRISTSGLFYISKSRARNCISECTSASIAQKVPQLVHEEH